MSVGPLRARFLDHFAPYVRDVVFAGADRDDIAVLIFPDVEGCRKLALSRPTHLSIRSSKPRRCGENSPNCWSSSLRSIPAPRPAERAILMAEPPSMDKGEMTDKGSINQRAVLKNRSALVDELYAVPLSSRVIAGEGKR